MGYILLVDQGISWLALDGQRVLTDPSYYQKRNELSIAIDVSFGTRFSTACSNPFITLDLPFNGIRYEQTASEYCLLWGAAFSLLSEVIR
jgi:hypothetical protein